MKLILVVLASYCTAVAMLEDSVKDVQGVSKEISNIEPHNGNLPWPLPNPGDQAIDQQAKARKKRCPGPQCAVGRRRGADGSYIGGRRDGTIQAVANLWCQYYPNSHGC